MALTRTISNADEASAGPTLIAIDRDKNSQFAVKWAVDHLLKKNSSCTLVHVRTQSFHPHDNDHVPKGGRSPTEEELHQFFLPFRGFCARKGITAKELVLHDIDVPSALCDYIIDNSINNIVLGASHRNALTRKFKDADVPTSLVRSLPESCTIHIISKGKVQNIKPTTHPQNVNVLACTSTKDAGHLYKHPHNTADSEDKNRYPVNDDFQSVPLKRETNSPRLSTENSSTQTTSDHNRHSIATDISGPHSFQSTDVDDNLEVPRPSKSTKALEVEIQILKRELKQTMEKYSLACKEAIAAKHRTTELEQIRKEEERNLEKARLAEEAALALAEVERQKAKAATESAQMAQRLAEMETQKRQQAEIRAMHEEKEKRRAVIALSQRCRKYDIKDIEVATGFFSDTMKIGEGGYGPVYKGILEHTAVAIKVLRPDIAHGERQFQQEVDVLSTIRHPNMVILLGACPEYGCLVYEYLDNGSLEDRLFQKDNTPPIPWKTRFKIAAEIATGLLFLHQTKPEPIVHRDLKPGNILLDRNYVSKISDVGLARLVPPSVANKTTQYHLTAAAGTFCYIDPEYQQTGLLGVKSDIYSLGVMLLQIITAKPPMGLAHQVDKAIRKGVFPDILDPSVTDWPVEEVLSYAMLALKCCELRKRDRPSLGSVILPELCRLRDLGMDSAATDPHNAASEVCQTLTD